MRYERRGLIIRHDVQLVVDKTVAVLERLSTGTVSNPP